MNAEALKIGKEADEANAIATQVQIELDKALPALQAAEDALNVLTKKDMSELKAYAKPPGLVELTLSAVMTVRALSMQKSCLKSGSGYGIELCYHVALALRLSFLCLGDVLWCV